MAWSVLPLQEAWPRYEADWAALSRKDFGDHPLLSIDFIGPLVEHFGSASDRLAVYCSKSGTEALTMLTPGALKWRSFRPGQAPIAPHMINDPSAIDDIWASLGTFVQALDVLCQDPHLHARATTTPRSELVPHVTTINVALAGTFDSYWAARAKSLQQDIRNKFNRVRSDGLALEMVVHESWTDIAQALGRYAELESSSWKGDIGTALRAGEHQYAFYSTVLERFARRGAASVFELYVGPNLAASEIVVRGGDMAVLLKTTHKSSLARYAPGYLLDHLLLKHEFSLRRVCVVEFYTDANEQKQRWSTGRRAIEHHCHYRWQWSRQAADAVREIRNRQTATAAARSFRTLQKIWRKTPTQGTRKAAIEVISKPGHLPQDARKLFEAAAVQRGTQLGLDWFAGLAEHIFGDSDVCFFVLRHDGAVVAVIPMVAATRSARHAYALSNYYTALFSPVIVPGLDADDLAPLIRAMRQRWPEAGSLTFAPMDPLGREYVLITSALRSAGMAAFDFFRFANWSLPCEGWAWADYLASRDGSLRSTISRMSKRLSAEGGKLELVSGGLRLELAIRAYERVYAASWKQAEPHSGFMPAMMRAWAERGWLRMGLAWLGERPIAAQCWIVANRHAEIFKLAHDEQFKHLSAGTLLTAFMMEHVLTHDRVQLVDYLIGDDAYKASWMTRRQERWGIVAYDPWRAGGLVGLLRETVSRSIKRHSAPKPAPPPG